MKEICFISIFILSCSNKEKTVTNDAHCNCFSVEKYCGFYLKLDTFLARKSLIKVKSDFYYYNLIKKIEKRDLIIDPNEIWFEKKDPRADFVENYDEIKRDFDSLFLQNSKLFELSRKIINDPIQRELGASINDTHLYQASLDVNVCNGNQFALLQYVWLKILEIDAEIFINEKGR